MKKKIKKRTMMKAMMKARLLCAILSFGISAIASAQTAVQAESRHELLLASKDPVLAANKKLVYDFWREVFEAGHTELAEQYLAESYVQHNPNVPNGRASFVAFLKQFRTPQAIATRVKSPLVSIVAENDLVIMSFVKIESDRTDPTKKYTTTWFDMFRVEDGKIVEHWDAATK